MNKFLLIIHINILIVSTNLFAISNQTNYFSKAEKDSKITEKKDSINFIYTIKCIKIGSQKVIALFKQAYDYYVDNDLEKALKVYQEILAIESNNPFAYNYLGAIYALLEKFYTAKSCMMQSVQLSPEYEEAYNNLGNLYNKRSLWKKSIKCYKTALELDSIYIEALFNLGLLEEKINRYDSALENYKKIIRLEPNFYPAYYAIGNIYSKKGLHKKAISLFQKFIIKKSPNFISPELKNYEMKYKLTQIEKDDSSIFHNDSLKDLKEDIKNISIKSKTNNQPLYLFLEKGIGNTLTKKSNQKITEEILTDNNNKKSHIDKTNHLEPRVHNIFYKNPSFSSEINTEIEHHNLREIVKILFKKGLTAYKSGKYDSSLFYYKRILELSPGNVQAYYSLGTVKIRLGNHIEAENFLLKAIKTDKSYIPAYRNLGFLYKLTGDYKKALENYEKILEIDPKLTEVYCNIGDIYFLLDRPRKKVEYYQKAANLGNKKAKGFLNSIGIMW